MYFNRALAALPFSARPAAPIFILGTGRSGTTILGKILSLHSDVGFLNEPKILWHIALPTEDINGNYTDGPGQYRLGPEAATPSVVTKMRRIYRGYSLLTGSSRVVDKYPELIFRISFVQKIFPDAKFVLLIRNGADTCRSIASWSVQHGDYPAHESLDWWGKDDRKWKLLVRDLVANDPDLSLAKTEIASFTDSLNRAAVEWVVTMREARNLLGKNDAFHELRYESLLEQPDVEIEKLLEFCGLEADTLLGDYASDAMRSRAHESSLVLHPAISDVFWNMMIELGYEQK